MAKDEEKKNGGTYVTFSGATVIVGALSFAIIGVWLYLAYSIIRGAISNPTVLDNIEGLLTALAVLTLPAMKVVEGAIEVWRKESDAGATTTPKDTE